MGVATVTKTIVWCGDGGVQTGFSRVNHSIIENLPPDKYDIHHIAVNYRGDYYETKPWHKLYPAHLGGDYLGIGRLGGFIKSLKPDLVFFLQDLWILKEFEPYIPNDIPTVAYFPLDAGPIDPEWADTLEKISQPVAYTNFGRNEALKVRDSLNVRVIPHGIDTEKFYPIPKADACALMNNAVKVKDWIILNANRNQPRKRVDLTIKGFGLFAEDKPANVRLYLHMGIEDAFVRIDKMMLRHSDPKRLYITSPRLSPANAVSDERLNWIYNCCDVGINTSLGEGWGLVPFEHAATGAPQIVPDNSASAEIFADGRGIIMPCNEETITAPKILTEGRAPSVIAVADAMQYAYDHPKEMKEMAESMYDYITLPTFQWANIASQWDALFEEVLGR